MGLSPLYQGPWGRREKRRLSANETEQAQAFAGMVTQDTRVDCITLDPRAMGRQKERNGQSFVEGDCDG